MTIVIFPLLHVNRPLNIKRHRTLRARNIDVIIVYGLFPGKTLKSKDKGECVHEPDIDALVIELCCAFKTPFDFPLRNFASGEYTTLNTNVLKRHTFNVI